MMQLIAHTVSNLSSSWNCSAGDNIFFFCVPDWLDIVSD
jgi:hypothetical protein